LHVKFTSNVNRFGRSKNWRILGTGRKAANASISFYGPLTDRKRAGDRLHGCNVPIKHSRRFRESREIRNVLSRAAICIAERFFQAEQTAKERAAFICNAIFINNFYNRRSIVKNANLAIERTAMRKVERASA